MNIKRPFYGWINLGVLWFCYCTVVASISYAFGVVVSDMADSLGMTMTMATGAYTGYTLTHALTAPLAGKFINRFGAKTSMLTGLGTMLIGCLLLATVGKSIWFYYAFWIFFVGFGMRFGTLLPSQVNISKWFFNYRGLAMSLLLTAGGIGGYIFTPLCTKLNEQFSWRGVWLMIAGLAAISMLLVLMFVREGPEKYGLSVDGGKQKREQQNGAVSKAYKTSENWKMRDARKRPEFYMLIFLYFASSYQLSVISSQGINHLALQGVERTAAASAVGLFAFINTFGRIAVGVFGDRVDLKKILAFGAIISMAGFWLLMEAQNMGAAYAALILSGLGYGIVMVAPQNMLLNYFGSNDYANINGLYSMAAGALSAAPAVIVGWFFDMNGNYNFAWIFGIILMVVAFAIAVVIRPPILNRDTNALHATAGKGAN